MNRSRFLRTIFQAGVSCAVAPWLLGASPTGALPAVARRAPRLSRYTLRSRVAGLFGSPDSAAEIGVEYLRQFPDCTQWSRLLADAGVDLETPRLDRHERAAAFDDVRRRDFLAGHTVVLDGWVLARSEVACCGILAVLEAGG